MTNRIVAVDVRGSEEYRHFIYESFKRITAAYPKHSFLFISDNPDPSFNFSGKIISEVVKQSKISLLSQLKISSLLKKYKAGVFVSAQILSQTKVPQCLIAWDNFTARSLKEAKVVITGSKFSKKEVIEKYKIGEDKIDVVYKPVDEIFQPVEFEEKEQIKEQYADSNEYFLSPVTTKPALLSVLKAFSVFKKMQKSSMQLLIAPGTAMNTEFTEALRLYKFKSEVKLLESIGQKELAGIIGSAYAFVYPEGEYFHVFTAMRSNVPVVTVDAPVMHETASDAALYFNSDDHKDIADKMMLIYKDESLRQQMIEKGMQQVKSYSPEISAEKLWQSIQKAIN